jgi:MerR family mercuric resistance operon transcriptional regulator
MMNMARKKHYQIGELAERTQTSVHTIRYYETLGLIPKPPRSDVGFRRYSLDMVNTLLFIKKAQSFGLTLMEVKKISACGERGLEPCCDLVKDLFTRKIKEFETKIQELQSMKKKLNNLLSGWVKPMADCRKC